MEKPNIGMRFAIHREPVAIFVLPLFRLAFLNGFLRAFFQFSITILSLFILDDFLFKVFSVLC